MLSAILFCQINLQKKQKEVQDEAFENQNEGFIGKGMGKKEVQEGKKDKQTVPFDRLDVKLQKDYDPKQKVVDFAINWAEEIRKEIIDRDSLRSQIAKLSEVSKAEKNNSQDQTNFQHVTTTQINLRRYLNICRARSRYLNYLQNGIQFFGLQRAMIEMYTKNLENQIV